MSLYILIPMPARWRWLMITFITLINTLRPKYNGRHFPDDILKWIFVNENVWTSIRISLKFVPRGPISNISALVQIMAWRRQGDKPLSELIIVRLLAHICVTRPQWDKGRNVTNNEQNTITYFSKLIVDPCSWILRITHMTIRLHSQRWYHLTTWKSVRNGG